MSRRIAPEGMDGAEVLEHLAWLGTLEQAWSVHSHTDHVALEVAGRPIAATPTLVECIAEMRGRLEGKAAKRQTIQ